MIAQIFLILLLLIIFSKKVNNSQILFIIFGIGLITSHYSLAYFFILLLIIVFVLLSLLKLYKWFVNPENKDNLLNIKKIINSTVNIFDITILIFFIYLWYTNIAGGFALKGLNQLFESGIFLKLMDFMLKIGITYFYVILFFVVLLLVLLVFGIFKFRKNRTQVVNIYYFRNFINSMVQFKWKYHIIAVLSLITFIILMFVIGKPQTLVVAIQRYLNFVLIFFTLIGLLALFLRNKKMHFKTEYLLFSLVSFLVLIIGIFFPVFGDSFGITRIFQMTFILLSPVCVVGGIIVFKSFFEVLNRFNAPKINKNAIKIFSAFLMIFLLFNTGFSSVIINTSIPVHLSSQSDVYPRFDFQETSGAQWLYTNRISDNIYADEHGMLLFKKYLYYVPPLVNYKGQKDSYIFARKFNQENKFLVTIERNSKEKSKLYEDMSNITNIKNKIYDNGEAKVYFS